MSVSCILIPFQPDKWETTESDLKIDPSVLEDALLHTWPETTIYPKDASTSELLLWSFNHKGGPGRLMSLLGDNQIVSLGIDVYLFEFVKWYRSFIPSQHPIFLSCSCYHESYYIQIFENTTELDLEEYYSK